MELVALRKRVIGLDVHQAQITACAIIEETDGTTRIQQRQFNAGDRRTLEARGSSVRGSSAIRAGYPPGQALQRPLADARRLEAARILVVKRCFARHRRTARRQVISP